MIHEEEHLLCYFLFENQKTKVIPRSKQQAKFTFTPVGDAKVPEGILDKLSAHITSARLPDLYNSENDYFETQEGKKLPIIHCVKNSKGWYINDDILIK